MLYSVDLISFLYKVSGRYFFLFILLGVLAGLSNGLSLALINEAVGNLNDSEGGSAGTAWLVAGFIGSVVLYIGFTKVFQSYMIRISERILCRLRLRILNRLRFVEMAAYDRIGKEDVYAALTRDTAMLGLAVQTFVFVFISSVTILFCLFYLAWISWKGLLLVIGVLVFASAIYLLRQGGIMRVLRKARNLESRFFKYTADLLHGMRQIRMDADKNADLYENYLKQTSEDTMKLNIRGNISLLDNRLLGQFSFLILVGLIVFATPGTGMFAVEEIFGLILVSLYMLGPVEGIMRGIPSLSYAGISIRKLQELEAQASDMQDPTVALSDGADGLVAAVPGGDAANDDFESLQLESVTFSYGGQNGHSGFSIGPLELEVRRGELIFLIGGNGSGKSTLMNVLCGLFRPSSGRILLNGVPVEDAEIDRYRRHFVSIFTDHYLFDTLYGRSELPVAVVDEWTERLEMQGKFEVEGNVLKTSGLSAGQKKRLAMILALAEEKSILFLDEWDAEQDPGYKRYFFEVMLPWLTSQGKTLIVITHNDRYYHTADQLLKMEDGQLFHITPESQTL